MTSKNKGYLLLAVFLGIVVMGNEMRKVSWQDISIDIIEINWWWISVAVLCMLIHWGIEAKLLQLFLKRTNPSYSFKNSYRIPLIEHLFNEITPFSTGGQPAQIVAMSKSGVDPGVATSVSLMKFVVYQIWIVINFLLCMIFGYKYVSKDLSALSILVLLSFLIHLVVVIGLLMVMYWYPFTQKLVNTGFRWLRRVKSGVATELMYEKINQKMDNFYAESLYMKDDKLLMVKASILTILQLVAYYIVPYFILRGLNVNDITIYHVVVLHAFIILIISLFPIPGGVGGAEYSFGLLFGTFMGTQSKMVLAILLWRIVTYYMGIVLGLVALLVKPDKDMPSDYVKPKKKKDALT